MKFSQRIGKTPLAKEIQLESMDFELKTGLWNVYSLYFLQIMRDADNNRPLESWGHYCKADRNTFCITLWQSYFKKNIDNIPSTFRIVESEIRDHFFQCEWYKTYDFLEFNTDFAKQNIPQIDNDKLYEKFNKVLETEFAGYRFIDGVLSPITNATEIQEIEISLSTTERFTPLKNCNIHLKDALDKLSDRNNPDYRNSIKEAISAVECIAKIISRDAKDSLSGALDKIKGKIKIHHFIERGFKQLYNYTSDEGGIRHAFKDETIPCDFEDAKFMLVSCSAFINYLVVKADKAGIDIKN